MDADHIDQTKVTWNSIAADWDLQVGDDGDANRILNSDPVLWEFAGEVSGLTVLDAGCGTGYLTRKLQAQGAKAIGIEAATQFPYLEIILTTLSFENPPVVM